jgi:hypothetical protein
MNQILSCQLKELNQSLHNADILSPKWQIKLTHTDEGYQLAVFDETLLLSFEQMKEFIELLPKQLHTTQIEGMIKIYRLGFMHGITGAKTAHGVFEHPIVYEVAVAHSPVTA